MQLWNELVIDVVLETYTVFQRKVCREREKKNVWEWDTKIVNFFILKVELIAILNFKDLLWFIKHNVTSLLHFKSNIFIDLYLQFIL